MGFNGWVYHLHKYFKTDLILNKHPSNLSNLKNIDYPNPYQILLKYIITDRASNTESKILV